MTSTPALPRPPLLLAALVLVLAGGAAWAEPLRLQVAVQAPPPPPAASPLLGLARLELRGDARVGGLSSILVLEGGARLLLATDRGWLISARPRWGAAGALAGLDDARAHRLPLPAGWSRDVEAMAIDRGDLVVATEGGGRRPHRLVRFVGPVEAPSTVASDRVVADLGLADNRGFEALVDLPAGGWLAIGETNLDGGFPALARDGRRWRYAAAADHAPTGADRLDDRIFVVERKVSLLGGWQARITCLPVADLDRGPELRPRVMARLGVMDEIDNLEGIAVWRRGNDLEMVLVSDDNFHPAQRSLLLHYRWPDGARSGGCGTVAGEDPKR